jgi:hypothetical protein
MGTFQNSIIKAGANNQISFLNTVEISFVLLFQDLEENQSEKNQKYRDLRKREETMDSFLASFESNRAQVH